MLPTYLPPSVRLLGARNTHKAPAWGSACKTNAVHQSCRGRGRPTWSPGTQDPHRFQTFLPPPHTVGKTAEGGLWTRSGWMERGETTGKLLQGWWGETTSSAWRALEGSWKPLAGAPDTLAPSYPRPHSGASWKGPVRGGLSFPRSPAGADSLSSSWNQASWVWSQAVSLSSCEALGRRLTLSGPRFFLCKMETVLVPTSEGGVRIYMP